MKKEQVLETKRVSKGVVNKLGQVISMAGLLVALVSPFASEASAGPQLPKRAVHCVSDIFEVEFDKTLTTAKWLSKFNWTTTLHQVNEIYFSGGSFQILSFNIDFRLENGTTSRLIFTINDIRKLTSEGSPATLGKDAGFGVNLIANFKCKSI